MPNIALIATLFSVTYFKMNGHILEPFRLSLKDQTGNNTPSGLHSLVLLVPKLKINNCLQMALDYPIPMLFFIPILDKLNKCSLRELIKVTTCSQQYLRFKAEFYKSLPPSLPQHGPIGLYSYHRHLVIRPCISRIGKTQNNFVKTFIRTVCFSSTLKTSSERKSLKFTIQESNNFHLNLSFVSFHFTAGLWCFTDFTLIRQLSRFVDKTLPECIYCGRRHACAALR